MSGLGDNTTDVLTKEAERRGITPVFFPDIDPKTTLFEYKGHREYLFFSRTDHHGAVTLRIFENKSMTTTLLKRGGFPVPAEILTADLDEAKAFLATYQRVVVKPLSNTGGIAITTDIRSEEQLARAFDRARDRSNLSDVARRAVFQQHVDGRDYRVLVVNQQHTFVIERIPAHVVGDGVHTITELVATWNATRKPECRVRLDELTQELLHDQDLTLSDVPSPAKHVLLAYVANYHSGGQLRDATDELGEAAREIALNVARYFDVPLVGVDFISPDIATTPGYIIELNGTPDITIHHFPDEGQGRDVSAAVIDMLFPETAA